MTDDPERADPRRYTSSPSRSDREFHIAEGMGALRALVENTCRAIDRNSSVLENHIKDSQSDFRSFREYIDLELNGVKKRIGDLESVNARETAQKEQIGVWAKVVYTVFGGQPNLHELQVTRNPLGPLQGWGEALRPRY